MKANAHQIIGKTIIGFIIKATKIDRPPHHQLFPIFDDHTSYEFYSDAPINPTGGLDKMSFNEVCKYMGDYMGDQMKIVYEVYIYSSAIWIAACLNRAVFRSFNRFEMFRLIG